MLILDPGRGTLDFASLDCTVRIQPLGAWAADFMISIDS
jgi:hypothetical protein